MVLSVSYVKEMWIIVFRSLAGIETRSTSISSLIRVQRSQPASVSKSIPTDYPLQPSMLSVATDV